MTYEWQHYRDDSDVLEEFYVIERGQNEDGTGFVKYREVDEYWHKVMQRTDAHRSAEASSAGQSGKNRTIVVTWPGGR